MPIYVYKPTIYLLVLDSSINFIVLTHQIISSPFQELERFLAINILNTPKYDFFLTQVLL